MNKVYRINMVILTFLCGYMAIFIYKTSLSCNYSINVVSDRSTWDGVCQLGVSKWTISSNDNHSVWSVSALSFYHDKTLYYFVYDRRNVKNTYKDNDVDKFQILDQKFFRYSTFKINKEDYILFSMFPDDFMYLAKIKGSLGFED